MPGSSELTTCFNLYFNAEVQYDGRVGEENKVKLLRNQRRKALKLAAQYEANPDLSKANQVEHIVSSVTSREMDHNQRQLFSEERTRVGFVHPTEGRYAVDLKKCDDLLGTFINEQTN